jgi:hypothetical protein
LIFKILKNLDFQEGKQIEYLPHLCIKKQARAKYHSKRGIAKRP